MKKLFALLLALTLVLSLAACGGKENNNGSGNNTPDSSSGDNSTPSSQSTGGTSQGGNDTNQSGYWTDTDAQTVNPDDRHGDYVITIWDAKPIDDSVTHPGSAQHMISNPTGDSELRYAPFKVVYTNTTSQPLGDALGSHAQFSKDVIFQALEGEEYSISDGAGNSVGVRSSIQPGETVTLIGYIQVDTSSRRSEIDITAVYLIFNEGSARPEIQQ
ncbi:MAG: hypothetical protein LBM28_02610 [Oscillospiraceae bacterium]|jgi:hypothetical protein|nr:hypothetical protein [Oscillospiraceae bacterium]